MRRNVSPPPPAECANESRSTTPVRGCVRGCGRANWALFMVSMARGSGKCESDNQPRERVEILTVAALGLVAVWSYHGNGFHPAHVERQHRVGRADRRVGRILEQHHGLPGGLKRHGLVRGRSDERVVLRDVSDRRLLKDPQPLLHPEHPGHRGVERSFGQAAIRHPAHDAIMPTHTAVSVVE